MSPRVTAAVEQVKAELRYLPVERAALVLRDGSIIRGPDGTRTMSRLPEVDDWSQVAVELHNHPQASAPSPQDLYVFDERAGVEAVIVVTPAGDYTLRPGPDGWGSWPAYMLAAWGRAEYHLLTSPDGRTASERFWRDVAPVVGWTFTFEEVAA